LSCFSSSSLFLFFCCSSPLPVRHSFPTRRSSDLAISASEHTPNSKRPRAAVRRVSGAPSERSCRAVEFLNAISRMILTPPMTFRSEEHTSELQSRENLVCRLLLEKKKGTTHGFAT